MKVIRASAMGMCFGVRDALDIIEQLPNPKGITIYGELVHNEEVVEGLKKKGFQSIPESQRKEIPDSPEILITAHGISEKEKTKFLNSGKNLIDTTCPLVRYVHESAKLWQTRGYFIVVIGKPNHVEVQGIIGDLDKFDVVQNSNEVKYYDAEKIAIVCQTTTQPMEAARIREEIVKKNPHNEIRYIDTICRPTKDRQFAALDLIQQVEALVVVGGKHSNNTKQLVKLAESHHLPVFHVQTALDLNPIWLQNFHTVGLTAGTSTLDETIDAVEQKLRSINELKPAIASKLNSGRLSYV